MNSDRAVLKAQYAHRFNKGNAYELVHHHASERIQPAKAQRWDKAQSKGREEAQKWIRNAENREAKEGGRIKESKSTPSTPKQVCKEEELLLLFI